MIFIERVIEECKELWDGYLEQPFLKDLRNNTLEEEIFLQYLKEDSKYLKDYARVFGMGIYKSKTTEEILLFYEMLNFVEASERAVRVKMLHEKGFKIHEIEQEEQHCITKQYTDFLLKTAQCGELVDILFATLPCMLSYAYIGQLLQKENPNIVQENTYGEWIEEYVCDEYIEKCKKWMLYANEVSETCSDAHKQQLKALFKKASMQEQYFWNMSSHRKVR